MKINKKMFAVLLTIQSKNSLFRCVGKYFFKRQGKAHELNPILNVYAVSKTSPEMLDFYTFYSL